MSFSDGIYLHQQFLELKELINSTKEVLMANVADVLAAVQAARTEIDADKAEIIAEIQRLGLPDEDLQPIIDAVNELGGVLDDVPGVLDGDVVPDPEPEPDPLPDPLPEPEPEPLPEP